jgi:hypothetical protein
MDICEKTPMNVEHGAEREVACHLHYDHERRVQTGADGASANQRATGTEGDD